MTGVQTCALPISNPTGWGRYIASKNPEDEKNNVQTLTGNSSLLLGGWHGSNVLVTQYSAPINSGSYVFGFNYIKIGGQNYRWGLSIDNNQTYLTGPYNNLNQGNWTKQSHEFSIDDNSTVTASFWEWNSSGITIYVDDIELLPIEENTITPYFSYGKTYAKGDSKIDIAYLNYDLTGAYAPEEDSVTEPDNGPNFEEKSLASNQTGVISILDNPKTINAPNDLRDIDIKTFESIPSSYTVEIEAKIISNDGRGLDIELRDADKRGYRFSIDKNNIYNMAIQNLPASLFYSETLSDDYHKYRFTVDKGIVYVYVDGQFCGFVDVYENMKPNNLIDNGGFEFNNQFHWTNPTGWGDRKSVV